MGGCGVYFGDHRDTAQCIPITQKQTNNKGELLTAIHAIRHRTPHKRTLICCDSKLVIMGATGKASKWRRHDWQGSPGPVGHVDLWEQLLREIEQAGAAVRWLHVPSHVGIVGNTHADTLADMGCRKSPLLREYVTSARRPQQEVRHGNRKTSQTWMSHPCFLLKSGRPTRPHEAPPPPSPADRESHHCWKIAPQPPRGHAIHRIAQTRPQDGARGRSPAHPGRHPCVTSGRNSSPHLPPPPSPDSWDEAWLAPRSPATASTITCSTEGSRCGTPDPSRPLFGTP